MTDSPEVTAIVGATLIDGNGGPPLPDTTVIIVGQRIESCGTQKALEIPSTAEVLDAKGKFLTPGFIDTNVHLTPFFYPDELLLYRDRYEAVALESAQLMLKVGVTTVRDTYGALAPLLKTRDAIDRGDVVGPRVRVAGNIAGWGGPCSITFEANPYITPGGTPASPADLTFVMEKIQDEYTQGVGEELVDMDVEDLREAIRTYLAKGVDFLKFGGTTHCTVPNMILFSARAQEVMIEEAHQRGMEVDVHSTSPEGLRMSLLAGVDVVQHPELQFVPAGMPDALVELHASSDAVCSMNVPYWTGRVWREYITTLEQQMRDEMRIDRPLTGVEKRKREGWRFRGIFRENAKKLIAAGCRVSTASDACALFPPELRRGSEGYLETFAHYPGTGTLDAIEGLVEIGVSPMQAIVAATKHGAMASKALDDYGTVEPGKSADLLLLDADPLADISNIRRLSTVIARGRMVDLAALPTAPIYGVPVGDRAN